MQKFFILSLEFSELHPIYLQTFFPLEIQFSLHFIGFENELS